MSVFDPLGLISCFSITLKIVLQKIWKSKLGGDQEINERCFPKWNLWKSSIERTVKEEYGTN